jgi:hypothetical protein
MAKIDWDKSVLEAGGPPSGIQYEATPQGGVAPITTSPLPEIGGLLGGVGGAMLTRSPVGAAEGRLLGTSIGRQFVPSLAGSTAGTAAGLAAETALTGQMTPERAVGALAENAAWDIGGNLAFAIGSKVYRIGADQLSKFGVSKEGSFGDAKLAAQKFLADRGATLTRSQLTGSNLDQFFEEISKGGTGIGVYRQQQENVAKALSKGMEEVKATLNTSETFNQALRADEPLTRAAGENFKNLITTARDSFKDTYRPFYQKLTEDLNAFVDLKPLKREAQKELDFLAKSKFAGAGAERRQVLEDILRQDDMIDFGVAHDLRSNFLSASQDKLSAEGKATALSAAYSKAGASITNAMDNAFSYRNRELKNTPYINKLINNYKNTQNAYREGTDALFGETINTAMSKAPSKAGAYVFDLAETEKSTDLFKAITAVDNYATAQGKQGAQVLNDFKYGFMEQALASPEKIKKFATDIDQNPETRRAFYKLFKSEAKPLQDILNAADIGLESTQSGMAAFLRNKATITGGQAAVGTLGYLALPADMQDKLKENLPETIISAGAFILTPRLIAKASTNPKAVSALADLSKASTNPRFAGAAAAKLVDRLNETGIIDSDYIREVSNILNPVGTQQPTTQIPAESSKAINWDEVVTE